MVAMGAVPDAATDFEALFQAYYQRLCRIFGAFSEALLRIVGLNHADARQFASQLAATPVWLFPIEPDEVVQMRQVNLRTGPGTLLQGFDEDGKIVRVTLLWSTPDRLYLISAGTSDEVVIAAANSIQ